MPNQVIACPICATAGKRNTFCRTCRWFLTGSLDAVSLVPIPEEQLADINEALQTYRADWQKNGQALPSDGSHSQIARLEQDLAQARQQIRDLQIQLEAAKNTQTAAPAPQPEPLPKPDVNDFKIVSGVLVKYLGSKSHVRVPDGVKIIGGAAFLNCNYIESVELPDSLLLIREYAFHNCTGLWQLIVPNSVKKIEAHAFKGCHKLRHSGSFYLPKEMVGFLNISTIFG